MRPSGNHPVKSRQTERRGNLRWFLVFWLFILSAVSFLDRVNVSVAGSSIAKEFGLSQVQLGWVFSAFLWGYALFQTLGGWMADRLGPRREERSRCRHSHARGLLHHHGRRRVDLQATDFPLL